MEKVNITVLGSGTCVPSLKRSSCSVLIQINQKKMVFDIGPGTTHRLLQTGLQIFDVSHIFLSHFYPECDSADIERQCRKAYNGPLILAQDLMTIPLGKG